MSEQKQAHKCFTVYPCTSCQNREGWNVLMSSGSLDQITWPKYWQMMGERLYNGAEKMTWVVFIHTSFCTDVYHETPGEDEEVNAFGHSGQPPWGESFHHWPRVVQILLVSVGPMSDVPLTKWLMQRLYNISAWIGPNKTSSMCDQALREHRNIFYPIYWLHSVFPKIYSIRQIPLSLEVIFLLRETLNSLCIQSPALVIIVLFWVFSWITTLCN